MWESEERNPKVVTHLRNGSLVKGYLGVALTTDNETLLGEKRLALPPTIVVRSPKERRETPLALHSLKALFLVKTFEGRKEYDEVRFFDSTPALQGLWVRIKFYDNESLEGVIRNSLEYLVNPGFFLKPVDPQSNNEMIYVLRHSLTDFRVLGVRNPE